MEQFLVIAAAHFLALLSPGSDFFLIARASPSAGWRVASDVFIVAAFAGKAVLRPDSLLPVAPKLAGSTYQLCLGVLFIHHAGSSDLTVAASSRTTASAHPLAAYYRAAGMGILNPKNALFYASLVAMPTSSPRQCRLENALWHPDVQRRVAQALPWL